MYWERRSGATFEGEKTTLIHFSRNPERISTCPVVVKGQMIEPSKTAKILGIIMDSELRYKQHIARAATKDLQAAMALKRLRTVSPAAARQLFVATVAPVVDYASNVWMHACGTAATASLNRVQRIGAQAITGCFRTVATAVAEAEASIRTVRERHMERTTKLWINIHTLPKTHPLSKLNFKAFRRFVSPLQKIAQAHRRTSTDRMEIILPFVVSPWEARLPTVIEPDKARAAELANNSHGVRIATCSSERRGTVGIGVAIDSTNTAVGAANEEPTTFSLNLGPRAEQNTCTAELEAMSMAMRSLPPQREGRRINIFSSNLAALLALSQPRTQSGQSRISQIYDAARVLGNGRKQVLLSQAPTGCDFELGKRAKEESPESYGSGTRPRRFPVPGQIDGHKCRDKSTKSNEDTS
jgi:hypothetical protein